MTPRNSFAGLMVTLLALVAAGCATSAPASLATGMTPAQTVQEIIAAKPTAEYDAKIEQAAMTSERFITQLYAELGGK